MKMFSKNQDLRFQNTVFKPAATGSRTGVLVRTDHWKDSQLSHRSGHTAFSGGFSSGVSLLNNPLIQDNFFTVLDGNFAPRKSERFPMKIFDLFRVCHKC